MKIVVTASKRDEILQRKAEYEKDRAERQSRYDEQHGKYKFAVDREYAEVEDAIRGELGDLSSGLDIDISRGWDFDEDGNTPSLEIRITNGGGGSPRRDPNASLSWNWDVKIDKNGEVVKDSGSWSGLEAVTLDQVDDLQRSVEQLRVLNTIDWKPLLQRSLPKYREYITEKNPQYENSPNFDQELRDVDYEELMEELVGYNTLVKGKRDSGKFYRGDVWYGVLRDSGSQYTVFEISNWQLDRVAGGQDPNYSDVHEFVESVKGDSYRIKKDNFRRSLSIPYDTLNY